ERNTRFALGAPAIARIELRFVASLDAQVAALRANDVDAALLGETDTTEARTALAQRRDLKGTPLMRTSYTALYMNNRRAPLDDVALRRALAASIDRDTVMSAASMLGARGEGVIVP